MKHATWVLLICSTVVLSQNSHAQSTPGGGSFYVEETFFPVYVKKNDAQSSAGGAASKSVPTESGLGYDFRTTLGYVWGGEWLTGLTYNYYQVNTSRALTPDYEGLTTNTNKQEFGPTVGYLIGSWRFVFTYFLMAQKTFSQKYTDPTTGNVSVDETYKNTGGSGFQFAVGYGLNLGSSFTIGPTLVYRSIAYTKQSYTVRTGSGTPYDSSSLSSNPIDAELRPMVTVVYRF